MRLVRSLWALRSERSGRRSGSRPGTSRWPGTVSHRGDVLLGNEVLGNRRGHGRRHGTQILLNSPVHGQQPPLLASTIPTESTGPSGAGLVALAVLLRSDPHLEVDALAAEALASTDTRVAAHLAAAVLDADFERHVVALLELDKGRARGGGAEAAEVDVLFDACRVDEGLRCDLGHGGDWELGDVVAGGDGCRGEPGRSRRRRVVFLLFFALLLGARVEGIGIDISDIPVGVGKGFGVATDKVRASGGKVVASVSLSPESISIIAAKVLNPQVSLSHN